MNTTKGTAIKPAYSAQMRLYDPLRRRLYINDDERTRFLWVAERHPIFERTFALTLLYTGCRISEALALTGSSLQVEPDKLSIYTAKKRRKQVRIREVPIPPDLAFLLKTQIDMRVLATGESREEVRLWDMSRTSGWRLIKRMMKAAEISGRQASPKGLRHGFGVRCVTKGVPLNLVQKWLGHQSMEVTAIYADAGGPEERALCARTWG